MRRKGLYPILAALVLIIFFSMSLLYMGCRPVRSGTASEIAALERLSEKEEELLAEKEEERLAKAEEEKQTGVGEAASKDKISFPSEPITYSVIQGIPIVLTVDFKTAEVTGLMSNPPYEDCIFSDGKIDLSTLEITTSALQITDKDSSGNITETTVLTITGKISDDFSTLNGTISNREGVSDVFTATR